MWRATGRSRTRRAVWPVTREATRRCTTAAIPWKRRAAAAMAIGEETSVPPAAAVHTASPRLAREKVIRVLHSMTLVPSKESAMIHNGIHFAARALGRRGRGRGQDRPTAVISRRCASYNTRVRAYLTHLGRSSLPPSLPSSPLPRSPGAAALARIPTPSRRPTEPPTERSMLKEERGSTKSNCSSGWRATYLRRRCCPRLLL